ncbi:peptidoglycan-associated lipoprotein Pal [Litorimonas sp. RW-G-Af-16]|uniref:peptidoglycan-associated lipoprotein Pal n=1 Tax=Litorimonas sp. RW-G-Af-16 TaxID=3241168 RepID=UPI00390CB5DC
MTYKALILGGLTLAALSACATKPDPVEEVIEAPVEQAPVFQAPVEQAPVIQAPIEQPDVVALDPNLPIPGTAEDFAYQSGGEARVFFGYDQYTLTNDARQALRSQAEWLKLYTEYSAVIEGHADERGTREYNLALGARRADAVREFLVSQGVNPSRLSTVSYGKERPIDPRSNQEGWARNRNGFTNLSSAGRS